MEMISVPWADFKAFITSRSLNPNYITANNYYMIRAQDDWFGLACDIFIDGNADQIDFETNFKPTSNVKIGDKVMLGNVDATTTEKALKVTPTKLEGSSSIIVSPNFCDKTTWYGNSVSNRNTYDQRQSSIPLGQSLKNFKDFIKCSTGFTRIEKFSDLNRDVIRLDYDYLTSKDLPYVYGAEVDIRILGGSTPFSGEWACVVANIISVNS